ncbi:phosphotransferase family protein [Cellulomonas gelida]|uniref:Aminoglycoside phosphotransferase domain-containing protein n=1 Tax=Cellulomonas gelida TaxID=1712 RepID=A0A4Y3KP08_9CELL|nr:aminoglycoside phosphotransferase family protein [Cellulomonas gelida]GEA85772.1 hypothetical protein CGE01nite_30230 [Cellulomonas gelida]GGL33413.1 hypothetical protein GCM10009774_24840 [Cellulomonas gelida]
MPVASSWEPAPDPPSTGSHGRWADSRGSAWSDEPPDERNDGQHDERPDDRPDEAEALAVLTHAAAGDLLAAALATSGTGIASWRVDAVHHRPGDGVTVGYVVQTADGRHEYLLATTSRTCPRDVPGTLVARGPAGVVVVWRHPQDPVLPALGRACDPHRLADALPGAGPVTALELVGYRPLRRAVVRAERDGVPWFVKVLRPGDGNAADVVGRHRLLADAGVPVPRVAHASDDGLVVLEAIDGVPLLDALVAGCTPALADVLAPVLAFPPTVLDLPTRRPWSSRARAYAGALEVRPALEGRAHAVAAGVRSGLRRTDAGPTVPTHGDLHEAQLLVDDAGRVCGLLDVDTVGPGHLVDDLGCLLAHLHAVRPMTPALAATALRWTGEAAAFVDPDALRVRVAGVLLSLAAGALPADPEAPVDDSERLLTIAEACLA